MERTVYYIILCCKLYHIWSLLLCLPISVKDRTSTTLSFLPYRSLLQLFSKYSQLVRICLKQSNKNWDTELSEAWHWALQSNFPLTGNNSPVHKSQRLLGFHRIVMTPLCSSGDTAAYLQNCCPAKCFSYLNLLFLPTGTVLCFSLLNCIPYSSGHSSSFPRLFHTNAYIPSQICPAQAISKSALVYHPGHKTIKLTGINSENKTAQDTHAFNLKCSESIYLVSN